jgi:integrase
VRGSIKKRPSGAWEVKFELPRGVDGKRRQRTVTVHGGKRDAERVLAKHVAGMAKMNYIDSSKMTVEGMLRRWLEVRDNLEVSTTDRYSGIVEKNIIPVLGPIKLSKLASYHLEDALTTWRKMPRQDRKGGKDATLSQRTVRHIWDTFRAACNYAVKVGLMEQENPCKRVEPPKKGKSQVKAANVDQAMELWEGLAETVLSVPTVMAFGTGMRRGEFLAVHKEDVDLEKREILVRRSLTYNKQREPVLKNTKTDRWRYVKIPKFAVPWLQAHLEDPLWPSSPLLFPDPFTGGLWSPDVFSSTFYYRVRVLKLPTISVQGLRHSFATVMLKAKVPMKVTSTALGHSTTVLTSDTYSHVLTDMLEDAVDVFDGEVSKAQARRATLRAPSTDSTVSVDRGGIGELFEAS